MRGGLTGTLMSPSVFWSFEEQRKFRVCFNGSVRDTKIYVGIIYELL